MVMPAPDYTLTDAGNYSGSGTVAHAHRSFTLGGAGYDLSAAPDGTLVLVWASLGHEHNSITLPADEVVGKIYTGNVTEYTGDPTTLTEVAGWTTTPWQITAPSSVIINHGWVFYATLGDGTGGTIDKSEFTETDGSGNSELCVAFTESGASPIYPQTDSWVTPIVYVFEPNASNNCVVDAADIQSFNGTGDPSTLTTTSFTTGQDDTLLILFAESIAGTWDNNDPSPGSWTDEGSGDGGYSQVWELEVSSAGTVAAQSVTNQNSAQPDGFVGCMVPVYYEAGAPTGTATGSFGGLTAHAVQDGVLRKTITLVDGAYERQGSGTPVSMNLATALSGVAVGDFVLLTVMADQDDLTAITQTAGESFTLLDYQEETAGRDRAGAVFYRFWTGDEATVSFESTGDLTEEKSIAVTVWRGVDPLTPFDVVYASASHHQSGQNNYNTAASAITTLTDGAMVVICQQVTHDDITTAGAPSGYSVGIDGTGTANDFAQQFHVHKQVDDYGTETPGAFTHTVNATIAEAMTWTLALRPEPVGTFTPAQFSGRLALWLDARQGVTDTAGTVTAWTDQGRDTFAGTVSGNPQTDATNLNGRNVIDLDGTDRFTYGTASDWTFLSNFDNDPNQGEIHAVIKPGTAANPADRYALFGTNAGSTANRGFGVWFDDRPSQSRNDVMVFDGTRGVASTRWNLNISSDDVLPANTWSRLRIVKDGDETLAADRSEMYVDDGSAIKNGTATNNASNSAPAYALDVGAGGNGWEHMVGSIAEVVIVAGPLNSREVSDLAAYLDTWFDEPAGGVTGTATGTFGGLSAAATGVRGRTDATATGTFGGLTASVSGVRGRSGTASGSFGGMSASAAGTVTGGVTGTATGSFGSMSADATGVRHRSGTATGTFGALSSSATGQVATAGTATGAFGALTATVTGQRGRSGTATGAFGGLTAAAIGQGASPQGTATGTFGALAATVSGTRGRTGTGTGTFGALVAAVSGQRTRSGTISTTFGSLSASATGTRGRTGTAAGAFGALTASATGTTPGNNGTATGTFGALAASGTGVRGRHGTISATFGSLSATVTAVTGATGTITTTFATLEATGTGIRGRSGTATGTFGGLSAIYVETPLVYVSDADVSRVDPVRTAARATLTVRTARRADPVRTGAVPWDL